MDGHKEPKEYHNESIGAPFPQEAEQINPPPPQPAAADQLHEVQNEMSGFERATLKWTKAAFVVACVAAILVGLQWKVMHRQLDEMAQTGLQTDKLIKQASIQANAAKATADATNSIANRVLIQAEATTRYATQAKRSADIAESSMRPWIGLYAYKDHSIVTQKPIRPIVIGVIANSGKTPATKVKIKITSAIRSFFDEQTILASINKGGKTVVTWDEVVIPPNGQKEFQIMNGLVGPDVPLDIPNGLYIVGEISYSDTGYAGVYSTGFCLRNINGSGFVPCYAGHWMK